MRQSEHSRLGGKVALRPGRDNGDVADATARLVKAVGKRVDDPEDLQHLAKIDTALRVAWQTAIKELRRSGYPDRVIGEALGTTRQAVEQRWPRAA
jgi:hypothetical protein